MRPEMELLIKSYNPDLPEDPITKTFDAIQNQVHTLLLFWILHPTGT